MNIAIRFVSGDRLSEIIVPCEGYKQMGDNAVRVMFKSKKTLAKPDVDTKVKVGGEIKEVVVV